MSAPHTPAPWVVATDVFGKLDISVFAGQVRYDSRVAMINGRESKDDIAPPREQALANAHLTSAAPELLEVARIEHELQMRGFTLATARSLGPDAEYAYRSAGAPGLNNWRRQKREAAIAKAEGRAR